MLASGRRLVYICRHSSRPCVADGCLLYLSCNHQSVTPMEPSPERPQLRLCQVACLGFLAFSSLLCSAAAPINDTCAGAVILPEAGPFPFVTEEIDVTNATSGGDPALPPPFTPSDVSRSTWYRFVPASSGLYTLSVGADTKTSVMDTLMGMYRASGCGNVSALYAFNDDSGEL